MFRNPLTDGIIVLAIVLLIFGPKRLPLLGRQLGAGLREFKDSITGDSKADEDEDRPALTAAQAPPPTAAPAPSAQAAAPAASGSPAQGGGERQS